MNYFKLYGKDGCPKCFYCETKLTHLGVNLIVNHNEDDVEAIAKEFSSVGELPILIVDDNVYEGANAVSYVKELCK